MMTESGDKPVSRTFVMALCFLVTVLEGYDLQVISSAAPHLMREMKLGPEQIGIFFSATLVGLAIGAVIGGWLADRIGRKSALVWSVVALGAFTLVTAAADSFGMVLFLRVMAGIGLGGAMPTLIALIAEVSGGRGTTSAVTTIICGQPTGGIISGLVGKYIAEAYGWESLFLFGGALTVLVAPLLLRFLPETKPGAGHGGAGAVQRMGTAEALFGEGRASSTIFLWLTFILTLALLSVLLSWTPILMMGKGYARPVGLNAIIAVNIGGIIGGLVISRLIDRVGIRWPMLALYALMAVGLYFFAHSQDFTVLMLLAGVVGFGVLGAQFSLYGVAPRLYPAAGRGSAVGVAVAMGRIGSILGPLLIGGLLKGGMSEDGAVLLMAPISLAAGICLFVMTARARMVDTGTPG